MIHNWHCRKTLLYGKPKFKQQNSDVFGLFCILLAKLDNQYQNYESGFSQFFWPSLVFLLNDNAQSLWKHLPIWPWIIRQVKTRRIWFGSKVSYITQWGKRFPEEHKMIHFLQANNIGIMSGYFLWKKKVFFG